MTNARNQRSKWSVLVDWRFQGRVVSFIVLTGLLCIGTTSYLCYAYIADSYAFIFKYSNLPQEIVGARYSDLYTFLLALSLVNAVIMLLVATWALFMTHRAAGSVYHMRRVVDAVRSGNAGERVRLREKDEFQGLAKSLNALLDEMPRR